MEQPPRVTRSYSNSSNQSRGGGKSRRASKRTKRTDKTQSKLSQELYTFEIFDDGIIDDDSPVSHSQFSATSQPFLSDCTDKTFLASQPLNSSGTPSQPASVPSQPGPSQDGEQPAAVNVAESNKENVTASGGKKSKKEKKEPKEVS